MTISDENYQNERVIAAAKAIELHLMENGIIASELNIFVMAKKSIEAADEVPTPRDLIEQEFKK